MAANTPWQMQTGSLVTNRSGTRTRSGRSDSRNKNKGRYSRVKGPSANSYNNADKSIASSAVAQARATDNFDAFKEMMGISFSPVGAARVNRNQFKRGARDDVAFQLNGSLNSLTRQANQQRSDFAFQNTNLRNNQAQAGSDLSYILRALNEKMRGIRSSTNSMLDKGKASTDANFAQLQQTMASKNSQVDAEVAAETQRMGLSNNQKVDSEISRNADQDFLEGLAANNRASAASFLQQQQGNYNQQAGQMETAEQANFANKQADVKQTYGKALSELSKDNMRVLRDIGNKKQDIESQRNFLIQQRVDSMAASAQAAAEKRAQQNFANQMAVNKFNMGVSKQNYDQEYDRATLAISQKRLDMDNQKMAAGMGRTAVTKGVNGVRSLFAGTDANPRIEQVVLDQISGFARGDQLGMKDDKSNKAEVRERLRTQIEATSNLKGTDLTTTIDLLNEALDVYWDGI